MGSPISSARIVYEHLSTWRKVRRSGVRLRQKLTFHEREFYLNLRPALSGNSLVVYDIGAAGGILSSCLAKLENVREIHAFEPIPSAFRELSEHVKRWPQVVCHNVALGESAGQMSMHVINGCRDSSSLLAMAALHKQESPTVCCDDHLEPVAVVRLDDYARQKQLPRPDVIKIDTQGYEDRVLRGGADTVRQARYCVLEISFKPLYEGSPVFDDIYQQMRTLGYRLICVTGALYGHSGQPLQIDGIFENEATAP